ncbi:putative bifunctional diguanylate cyclase/phosphodiesterase [Pseudokineococcus sp. 1T1Z-3]|uniref:putative bifunctional diguanylate cyclase/phosphodiesterase n=1 Tax=Pseudokineococcus sp. 1T1Z-3 TaxID=3132745 RepID=UPI0030A9F1A6
MSRSAPSRRVVARWVLGLSLAPGLALLLTAVTGTGLGPTTFVAAGVSVLVACVVHRPARLPLWLGLAVAQLCVGAGGMVRALAPDGGGAALSVGLTATGAVCGVVVGVVVTRTVASLGGRVDVLDVATLAAVLGLGLAQYVELVGMGTPAARGAAAATVDVVIISLIARLAVMRIKAPFGGSLILLASLVFAVNELVRTGTFGPVAGSPLLTLLPLLGAALLSGGVLHPSTRHLLDRTSVPAGRHRSGEVLGLLPLALVPASLWVVDASAGTHAMPMWAHVSVGAVGTAVGVLRASSALRHSEHLAEHDPLTDLPNRRGLDRVFADRAPAAGWSLLLVDLDDFKGVNDAHGHEVGDALLLHVRDRLREAAGEDGVVARFGGDEFVVLVPGGSEAAAADRVVAALRPTVELRGLALRATGSVGVAPAEAGATFSQHLVHADVALYAAKGAGRDTACVYHPDQREEALRRFTLTNQVRQLLSGRSSSVGRLEVHYQPIVVLATGEAVGAEALVRWQHPDNGLMMPAAFLDHVSTSQLDAELDSAVLEEVVDQLGRWARERRQVLPVSVNLTRSSLVDPGLPGRVAERLRRAGVPGTLLHVEITEHEPLEEDATCLVNLLALQELGVDVDLDDYGSGYTSLEYLRRFPVQVIKVDRAVVMHVTGSSGQLLEGLGAMSRTLGLELLAEGVETPEQQERLVELGFSLGQGWLFSRALPADQFADEVLGPRQVLPPVAVPAPRPARARASEVPQPGAVLDATVPRR